MGGLAAGRRSNRVKRGPEKSMADFCLTAPHCLVQVVIVVRKKENLMLEEMLCVSELEHLKSLVG